MALVVGVGEAVRLSGGLVGTKDVEDTVGIDVEGDLDLRNTTGRRRDTGELGFAKEVIALGAGTFTLEDLDQHTGLVVGVGREGFGLLGRDGGVALDGRGRDTIRGLNTERKGNDIEKEDALGLRGDATGDDLIRVDRFVGLLSVEEVGNELDD